MIRMRKILKAYYLRQIVCCWVILTMVVVMPVRVAMAIPNCTDPGGATVDQTTPNLTDVLVNQKETLMAWDNLNTTGAETVAFRDGALEDTKVFSEITGGKTEFLGHLTGEEGMALYFRNRAGFLFGPKSTVDVTQLVVTSLNIDADDLMNGMPYTLIDGLGAGDITNEGTITAEAVTLIGKNVINKGYIFSRESVIMAAGDSVIITENGSNVAVEVDMGGQDPGVFKITNHEDGKGITVFGETAQIVLAAGDIWSSALVMAYSYGSPEAVATIDIDAAGDVIITDQVIAEAVGNRENNVVATVTIDAGGDVDVIAHAWMEDVGQGNVSGHEGKASITAMAMNGINNTAEILICADDVTVEAQGLWSNEDDLWVDSTASIQAIAEFVDGSNQSNTADVQIGAREGINVTAISKPYNTQVSASITAEAYNGAENTAGVLACANDDVKVISEWDSVTPAPSNAYIKSLAGVFRNQETYSKATTMAISHSEATTTVISHNGDVVVNSSLGGNASIESEVYGGGSTDTATTQVYATDVEVIGKGSSIKTTNNGVVKQRDDGYCMSDDGVVMEIGPDGTLIINGSDCPDCPPCPCKEEPDPDPLAPVAPLDFELPRIEGCPELLLAVSIELGTTPDNIQVAIGNALALNPNIQPCEACATLVNAVNILRDEDGIRMAAMNRVFNELAPADKLFTPEMADSIVTAFAGRVGDGTQYASAIEYIDAFVRYIAVLETELDSPVDDSVAFVMDKYGEGVIGSDNGNIAAFVATRLESLEAFGG